MKISPQRSPATFSKQGATPAGCHPRLPRFPLKRLVYAGLAVAVIALVVFAFRPTPIPVEVAQVTRGDLHVTVDAEAKTRVQERFVITAPANGHLDRIVLKEGDRVQRGMRVARIDPLPLTASVQEALGRLTEARAQRAGVETQRPKPETIAQSRTRIRKAEADQQQALTRVQQAQAALAQAQREQQRAQQLAKQGAIARQDREAAELNATTQARELEAAQLALQAAESEVDGARNALTVIQKQRADPDYLLRVYDGRIASIEAELSALRQEANRTAIRSPVSGRVLKIHQKSAQFVTEGAPLLDVGDTAQLELVIDVLSSDAVKIKPGAPIWVDLGGGNAGIFAKVRLVEPAAFTKISALGVEEQRVNVIGDFVQVPPGIGDAYRLDTRIVIWEGKQVLTVPLSALFRCAQADWCVFTVVAGRARRQKIMIGQHNTTVAEVKQGLRAGAMVILYPTEKIAEGSLVKPQDPV